MQFGFSSVIINPIMEVELSGYGWFLERKTTKIMDNIYARAVYLKHESVSLLLINCDLLGLNNYVVRRVKDELAEKTKIPVENIILMSTHTHTAPAVVKTIGCGEVSSEYIEFLVTKIIESGVGAYSNIYKVNKIEYCQSEISPIGYNRTSNGEAIDNNIYSVKFELENHRPFIIMNYSCHPVTLGRICEISPDYPGYVVNALNKKGYDGIFINGYCGDVDPINQRDNLAETIEELKYYANCIVDSLNNATFLQSEVSLKACQFSFDIELVNYDEYKIDMQSSPVIQAILQTEGSGNQFRSSCEKVALQWEDLLNHKRLCCENPYTEKQTVQAFRIGNIVFIATPGEIFSKVGLDVREQLKDSFIIFASNANSATRYIATDIDIENKGYAAVESNAVYCTFPIKKNTAQIFSDEIAKNISELLFPTN